MTLGPLDWVAVALLGGVLFVLCMGPFSDLGWRRAAVGGLALMLALGVLIWACNRLLSLAWCAAIRS